MKKGLLVVISGPSGAGKGTVLKVLTEKYDGFAYSVSVTTRAPRPGEVDGKHYFFKTKEQFAQMVNRDEFLETAEVYGNYYGTPKQYVQQLLQQGLNVILEIDTVGALNVKRALPEAVLIFIMPPSIEELTRRLTSRQTETESQLKLRLGSAVSEIKKINDYDYVVMNDIPEVACDEVMAIVRAESCKTERNSEIADKF